MAPLIRAQDQPNDPVITIAAERIKVEALLEEISRQSSFNFSYNAQLLDADRELQFKVDQQPLSKVLTLLEEKLDLSCTIIDRQIVLNTRDLSAGKQDSSQSIYTISGYLTDAQSGESLPGATVAVSGTSSGVVTNGFGYYTLNLPPGNHVLIYSYIGYEEISKSINLNNHLKHDVQLDIGSIELPNVIVALPIGQVIHERDPSEMSLNPATLQNLAEF